MNRLGEQSGTAASGDRSRSQEGNEARAFSAARDVTDKGKALLEESTERVEEEADGKMRVGAEQLERVSAAITKAADELESSPLLAGYARSMASGLHELSGKMRDRSAREVFREGSKYAQREPVVFFGAAVLTGFVLSRFLKSSSDGAQESSSRAANN